MLPEEARRGLVRPDRTGRGAPSDSLSGMLRGRSGLSPVMIGRHAALHRLVGLVEAAEVGCSDGPEIALVSGEAGIGKTRLLREFIDALPSSVTVLTTQARPGSLGRPFDVMGQLVPDATDVAAEVRALIDRALAAGRVLLVVEDLHWADADSAHLVEQLCMQPYPQLVVVGTYRGNDLSRKAPGGELVLRLERQFTVEQVRLDRLDRPDVAALLSAIGSGAASSGAVEAVFRRSGGIPFVVEELVRCCGPDACIDDLKTAQLPWSLDDAVRQQLGGLGPDARRVVDALAVFGDPARFDLLLAICELDDARLLTALRTLAGDTLVVEPADDTFWFAHALVADTVNQQLLGRERRRLHERSLAALGALPEPDHGAMARHALGAGRFELIPGIAREGARLSLDRGASFAALRLASAALAEAPDDPELLAVATDAAWRLEYGPEALAYAEQWHAAAVTDLERVESLRFIARLHHEMLHHEARDHTVARMEQMVDSLPPGMARGRGAGAVAQLHMLSDHPDATLQWADRALAEAQRTGDQWLEAQATVEKASINRFQNPREESEQALLHALELSRRVDDSVLECRALNNLLGVVAPHGAVGEWARAELRDASVRCGLDKLGAGMLAIWNAEAAFARGDMRTVRRSLAEAGQHWSSGSGEYCHHLGRVAELHIEEGRFADAEASLIDANSAGSHHSSELNSTRRLALVRAAVDGRRADAERVLDEVMALDPLPASSWSQWWMLEVVHLTLQAGVPASRVRADFVEGWMRPQGAYAFVARHAEGWLRAAEGNHAGAILAFRSVLEPVDPVLYVPTLGSLRTAYAASLLAVGDKVAALEAVQLAVSDLAAWPGWRRDRAESLQRRLEGAGQRTDGELTTRELEVAGLIAEGLTNSQLAERLFISPRTAAVHVSNILMKLGLSSRAEVAAWVVRRGAVLGVG